MGLILGGKDKGEMGNSGNTNWDYGIGFNVVMIFYLYKLITWLSFGQHPAYLNNKILPLYSNRFPSTLRKLIW